MSSSFIETNATRASLQETNLRAVPSLLGVVLSIHEILKEAQNIYIKGNPHLIFGYEATAHPQTSHIKVRLSLIAKL